MFRFAGSASAIALIAGLTLLSSCNKDKNVGSGTNTSPVNNAVTQAKENNSLTQVLTVANIRTLPNGATQAMFCENAEVFNISDPAVLSSLQTSFTSHNKVTVTFNPWMASISKAVVSTPAEITSARRGAAAQNTTGTVFTADQIKAMGDNINDASTIGLTKAVTDNALPRLADIIPNMATAQSIFSYMARQCCALPGPYNVDYCISFQYCEDGCYARAQKMGYVFDNTFHYSIHKIFSFANAGNDELSVEAEKWGGCCINWWYHVAPLLNIHTVSGDQAFVYDPAMFDQPVLLSTWLHAQENPACAGSYNPHVSMINIQPATSYSPTDYTGYHFDTDPTYSNTDATLSSYAPLTTCP